MYDCFKKLVQNLKFRKILVQYFSHFFKKKNFSKNNEKYFQLVNGLRHAISEKTANGQRTDQESDDWKICRVCQDRATGYHFNAMTCEGCKVT